MHHTYNTHTHTHHSLDVVDAMALGGKHSVGSNTLVCVCVCVCVVCGGCGCRWCEGEWNILICR